MTNKNKTSDLQPSQFSLLKQRRFLPFFLTQALGALNDNIFKNALVILIGYRGVSVLGLDPKLVVTAAAVIFILPFFLFSATVGQLADKYEKSRSIRYIKIAEIVIMLCATLGLFLDHTPLLLLVLFLMGLQSTVFGPIKYGLLPQHLHEDELVGGNALVESGTFIAILIGTILGGVLVSLHSNVALWLSLTIVSVSIIGYLTSREIPLTPSVVPELKINWNPVSETVKNLRYLKTNQVVFLAILGISWFWFYGAVFLAQIANYTQYTLAGKELVATLVLAFFSIGIGVGSILCERLSNGRVEIGLVPIGAIGLSLFAIDIYYANPSSGMSPLYSWREFLDNPQNWRVLADITLIGIFGGIYTVPLYSLVQQRSEQSHLSRIIASNNILNAFFMVVSGLFSMLLLAQGYSIPQLFLITGLLNVLVAIYVFSKAPEFITRFITWCLINSIYRIKQLNLSSIPKKGACVLVCNHVSFVDALIIGGYCKRNVRFVMDHRIFKLPLIGKFFKLIGAIPIAPAKEDPAIKKLAFDKIAQALEDGEVLCIFPEGRLTADGQLGEFKKGVETIIQRTPVPVVPMALKGLWGSWFSRKNGEALKGLPRKFMSKIELVVGELIPPEKVSSQYLQQQVYALHGY
ncbi:MAG: MFS transporter [Enterobacterales bacterium]|nr:MFS transporter [Enterobacterales bacterium]